MTPISLRIENWGPFKKAAEFTFPVGHGLYFLWGRNEVNPRMGANGCGKSRLWQALVWLIFGKTSTGLKAGDVANWDDGKGASVEFEYFVDNDPALRCSVVRTWSPNTWGWSGWDGTVVDLAKDESNALLSDLRLTFRSFLSTVLMAQDDSMFLDLKSDQQAALFSEVMDLDRWLRYADNASDQASDFDKRCRVLERELARLEGQRDQDTGENVEALADDWEVKNKARLDQIDRAYTDLLKRQDQWADDLKTAEAEEKKQRTAYADAVAVVNDFDKVREEAIANERASMKAMHQATIELRAVSDHLDFLEHHNDCPTCGRGFDFKAKTEQMRKAKDSETVLLRDLDTAKQIDLKCRTALDVVMLHQKQALADRDTKKQRLMNATATLADITRAGTILDQELDRLEDEVEQLEKAPNPFTSIIEEREARLAKIAKDIRQTRRLLDDADSQYRLSSYWVKGFKEIRLELIGEAIAQLEVEVNSEVSALGLVGWELRFEVDRETKGGSIQRGFNVTVISPHNTKPVPWSAWSGGEAQRLRVAAQAGLANLIRGNTGATIDLEVWDEPTKGMSPQGIADLLGALAERAEREQRQIWIVDHHSLSFGGFAGSALVVKTPTGSRFEQDTPYISGQEVDGARQRNRPSPARRTLADD